MKNLKKQFPIEDGWIHATLTLQKGHGLTVETLRENWRKFPGPSDAEIGHVEINGNKAKVISREPKKVRARQPRLTIEVTDQVDPDLHLQFTEDRHVDTFDKLNLGASMNVRIHPLDFAQLKSSGSRLLARATSIEGADR